MAEEKNWGATSAEWQTFIDLGLAEDLLPVVSNPGAPVSSTSTMKFLGKTPSEYNHSGEVRGIAKWTSKHTTDKQIAKWCEQPDYGICIQTRYVRAFDIDVEDVSQAEAITDCIHDVLGFLLPIRYRQSSGKCLLAFRMEGEYGKRTIKVKEGMIEMLMNGQQFVAAGTHRSGDRYEWAWVEEPCDTSPGAVNMVRGALPLLTEEQFETVCFILQEEFAVADTTQKGLRKKASKDAAIVPDDIYDYLEENDHVIEYGAEGQLHIECPFADEHTTESAVSATSYFPRGSRGYERGHFVCLHAHCDHREDVDFEEALGIRAAEMQELTLTEEEMESEPPKWARDKHGRPHATLDNVCLALEAEHVCKVKTCYDKFRDEVIFYGSDKWERENDNRLIILRRMLESVYGFKPVGRELMRDAVHTVAKKNTVDTAEKWINALEWDGVPRVESFLHEYLGADDTDYGRAISKYIWSAAAGRIIEPGVKADMIPIMKGPQGFRKSTAIACMAPTLDEFVELDFDEKDDDLARKMRGALVCEIPELRGLRTRAVEAIKAFVARTHEKWIPKYKEYSTTFPRRCIFIATTNDDEFLADSTGNRRWLPFEVKRFIDTDRIVADRAQLWAEGRELFKKHGVVFYEAEELAKDHHEQYMMRDAWFDVISDWLERPEGLDGEGQRPIDKDYLRIIDVARDALNIDPRQLKRIDEMKIADSLKAFGYVNKRKWVSSGGKKQKIRAWFHEHSDLA